MKRPFISSKAHTYPICVGVDEVGRGCLCACVLVASVYFDPSKIPGSLLESLDDSKRLTPSVRKSVAAAVCQHARVSLSAASPQKIDRVNIRQATLGCMKKCIENLGMEAAVYVDGNDWPRELPHSVREVVDEEHILPETLQMTLTPVIKGDRRVPQIAAASIVAKVLRDELLAKLGSRYPAYDWQNNAGYASPKHRAALKENGLTPHHRRSFCKNFV